MNLMKKRDRREYMKKWHISHKIHDISYREKTKEKRQIYNKNFKELHKEQIQISGKIYRKKNRIKENLRQKTWRKNNPEKYISIQLKHKPKAKEWRIKNKDIINTKKRIYNKKREANDLNYKLIRRIRHRIREALKGNTKSISTKELLGCSIEEVWEHLEKQFRPGMTRENYGKMWHVDHIKPCCLFDHSKTEEQKRCHHYTNLQPLWAKENLIKGGKEC